MNNFDHTYIDAEGKTQQTRFYNFGRDTKTMKGDDDATRLCAVFSMLVDEGNGKMGEMCYGYFAEWNAKQDHIYLKYDMEDGDKYVGIVSATNYNVLDVSGDRLAVGNPKYRPSNATNYQNLPLDRNVMVMKINVDGSLLNANQFPVAVADVKYIPPPMPTMYHVGAQVQISDNYLLYSDPNYNRGIVYISRKIGENYVFIGQINPFPRWGNFQNFGKIIRTVDVVSERTGSNGTEVEKTLLYVAAPDAWIHNKIRKAIADGMDYTEAIGVIYEFELEVGVGCTPKNYYVVKTPIHNAMMNSTITKMVEIQGRLYVTVADIDGLYQVTCDEKFTLHL